MINLHLRTAEVFVPDDLPVEAALKRTTHIAIGAHQDDLEFMAFDGILSCFQQSDAWFTGVIMTNGSGSPRAGLYAHYTDSAMRTIRCAEQKKAAIIGEYSAQVLLDYPSAAIKDAANHDPVEDVKTLLTLTRPRVIYTHNLADKHDTHVAVALRVIEALRDLPQDLHPQHFYGCEVWRDLDWMADTDKVVFDVSAHENLQAALMGVFDSQISGGKRYDLATMGRRRANATYFASHATDTATGLSFAMDLMPLIQDPARSVQDYVQTHITRFAHDVSTRLSKLGG